MQNESEIGFKYEIGELVFDTTGRVLKIVDRELGITSIDNKGFTYRSDNMYATVLDENGMLDYGEIISYYEKELNPQAVEDNSVTGTIIDMATNGFCFIVILSCVFLTGRIISSLIQMI